MLGHLDMLGNPNILRHPETSFVTGTRATFFATRHLPSISAYKSDAESYLGNPTIVVVGIKLDDFWSLI